MADDNIVKQFNKSNTKENKKRVKTTVFMKKIK